MSPTDTSPSSHGSQFDTAVRNRSWDWLLALRRRLNVDSEIVDDTQTALLGQASAPLGTSLAELLASGASGMRLALSTTMRTRIPQAINIGGIQAVCLPLTMGRDVAGALVVARRSPDDVVSEQVRGELELIGFWLANAIEAHLCSPSAAESDMERLSSLCRVLGDTASRGSDREIVAAFAQTLAVWHDLEVYGYVEGADGEFARAVSLPASEPSRSPTVIHPVLIPEGAPLTRLSRPDVERLGFASQELVATRIGERGHAWLVIICGSIASHEWTRLGVYIELLAQSIARAIEASTARGVASLSRQLFDDEQSTGQQIHGAIREMQETLGIVSGAVVATGATGAPLIHAGSVPGIAESGDISDGRRLLITRRSPQQYSMTTALEWSAGHRVTPQERRAAHAMADLIEFWLRGVMRQAKDTGDRRLISRSFDEILERSARQALDGGVPVTAVVLSFSDGVFEPGGTQVRVGRIREQVRPADLVGRIDDGEIGILLLETDADSARAVAARLQRVAQTDTLRGHLPAAVGLASRRPADAISRALTQEAREAMRPADES
jgi:hypothetical protein